YRPGAAIAKARGEAPRRNERNLRRADWADEFLGCEHHPRRRQLRRGLRAQPRLQDPARHPARAQSIMERRRHSIRAADPVTPPTVATAVRQFGAYRVSSWS